MGHCNSTTLGAEKKAENWRRHSEARDEERQPKIFMAGNLG